jgi:hypothetical protein
MRELCEKRLKQSKTTIVDNFIVWGTSDHPKRSRDARANVLQDFGEIQPDSAILGNLFDWNTQLLSNSKLQ